KVYAPDNTLVSDTSYTYDNYSPALVTRSGSVPGWTDPGTSVPRTNLTQVGRYLNTNDSWIQTDWRQYDVLGNVIAKVDAGNHQTTIDFTDRFTDSVNRYS